MPKKGPSLPQMRFLLYLQQRVAELNNNISAAGRELGLEQGYASMLYNGTRNAGAEVIEKAIEKHGIDRAFFRNPDLDDPSFRDFVGSTPKTTPSVTSGSYTKTTPIAPAETLDTLVALDTEHLPSVYIRALKSGRLGEVSDVDERAAVAYITSPQGAANEGGLTVDDVIDFVETLRSKRAGRAQRIATPTSGKEETAAARARGESKGHMLLPKPRRPR